MSESKNKLLSFFEKSKYEIGMFAFLAVLFILQCWTWADDGEWYETTFALSYTRFGFQSRMLIGTIMSFFKERIGLSDVFAAQVITCTVLSLLITFLTGRIIRSSDEEMRKALIVFGAVYLCSPVSFTLIYNYTILLDTFLYTIFVLTVLCILNGKFIFLSPVLCALGVMTHQVFTLLYMPAVGIIMLYIFLRNKEKKTIIALVISCIAVGLLFIKFQFGQTNLAFSNADDMAAYLQQFTDINVSTEMIRWEYFAENKDLFTDFIGRKLFDSLAKAVVMIIILLPILSVFTYLFISSIKRTENRLEKFMFFLCILIPIVSIPVYIMSIDWDRWTGMIAFEQMTVTAVFLFTKNEAFTESFKNLVLFFRRNKALIVLMIVFYASLETLCGGYLGNLGTEINLILKQ